MRFITRDTFLQIEISKVIGAPTVKLDVQVVANEFTGHIETDTWLQDLQQFLQELKIFEESRSGTASFKSIHPDKFQLEFSIINRHRDILMQGQLAAGAGSFGNPPNVLKFAFELDQEYFWGSVQAFEEMVLEIK